MRFRFFLPATSFPERETMPEERNCVVKLVDDHGLEALRATEFVYEAALKELRRLIVKCCNG
jgi:hypothetical protein